MQYIITNKAACHDDLIFLDAVSGMRMAIYQMPPKAGEVIPEDDEILYIVNAGNQREALYALHVRTSIVEIKVGKNVADKRFQPDCDYYAAKLTLTKAFDKEWYEHQP